MGGQILIFDPDDNDPFSKIVRSIVAVLIASVVAGGWYYNLVASKPIAGDGTLYIGKLREEFQRIPAPEGVSALDRLVVNSKSSSALVEQRYATRPSYDLILAHYDRQLKGNGWSYFGHYAGGSNGGESYCKGAFEASIEFMPKDVAGNIEYSFSMSWGGASVYKCLPKIQPGP
jgi:hypothetical protein